MGVQKLTIAIGGKLDSSLMKAVNDAQSQLDNLNGGGKKKGLASIFSGAAEGVENVLKASFTTFAGGLAGVTALSQAGVDSWTEYEAALSDVMATAGIAKGTEEWEHLDETIMHVGETTNKTATEAAGAAKYMFLAGWDQSEVEAGLDTMVMLSSALNSDMGLVSDLITDSMSAADIGVEEMQNYADMIAQADSAANYSGVEMMEAIKVAAGSARDAKVPIQDLATAAGILADNGKKGAEGGTALSAMLTNMFTETKNGGLTAMRSIGVDAYDAAGNVRPLFDIMTDLSVALDGLSDEDRNDRMFHIFGKSWKSQGRFLLDSVKTAKDGTIAYKELYEELSNAYSGFDDMGNSVSVLNERYGVMTDNLKGDKDLLSSAKDSFLTAIGKSMNEDLRALTQETTSIMQEFTAAFKEESWTGLAEQIGTTLGDISGVFGEKGAEVIEGAGEFVTGLTEKIGGQADDIGTAAAKIVTQLGTSFLGYPDEFVIAGGNLIKGLMDGMIAEGTAEQWTSGLTEVIGNIGAWFTENGAQLGESAGILVTQLATQISAHSGGIISGGIAIVGGIAKGILTGLPILVSELPNIMLDLVGGVIDSVPAFLSAGKELGIALMDGLTQIAESWSGISGELVIDGLYNAGDDIQFLADNAEEMNAVMSEMWANADTSQMTDATKAMVDNLITGKTTIESFSSSLATLREGDALPQDIMNMDAALTAYTGILGSAREEIEATQQQAQATAEAIGTASEAQVQEVTQVTEQLQGDVMEKLGQAQAEADAAGIQIKDSLTISPSEMDADALSTVINSLSFDNGAELTAQFSAAMTSFTTSANETSTAVSTAMSTMDSNMLSSLNHMQNSAASTANSIYMAFASIDLNGVAADMMAGLVAGIEAGGAAAIAKAQEIASQIAPVMQSVLQISSPSKVMEKIGMFTGQGLAVGMEDAQAGIYASAESMGDSVKRGAASGVLSTFIAGGEAGTAPGIPSGENITFNLNPQITINGNADESDVRNAMMWSFEQFQQMFDRALAERRRVSFT